MIELRDERGFADHGWLMINEDRMAAAKVSARIRTETRKSSATC